MKKRRARRRRQVHLRFRGADNRLGLKAFRRLKAAHRRFADAETKAGRGYRFAGHMARFPRVFYMDGI